MVKRFILIAGLFFSMQLIAQTGIGTTTPNASAKLDVYSTNKGFLPPRIALLSTTDVATITSPANGLIIYNTATAGTTPNNVLPGYYYWDGSKWNGLVDQGALNSFSGYVPNYAQSNASRVTNVSTSGTTIVSQTITTSGRPIQIIASGDANPLTDGGWCQLQLYRDGTAIGKRLQAESSKSNENIPYCLNFIDNPTAGTYTYSVKVVSIPSAFDFGEADGNQITLLELGAWSAGTMPVSKGGTGNSSYTAGSLIFSDGTNLTQNNSNLFWDNSNNKLGIGTNSPNASAILDISSSSKGVLPPKVVLTGRNGTSSPIASPSNGLFVYNTSEAGTAPNAVSPGFYFYNGTNWTRMDPEDWSMPATITIGAVTTAPTKGTIVYDKVSYRRTSTTSFEVTYNYSQSTVGTLGSGDYLFRLPENLTFGSSVLRTTSDTYETLVNRVIIGNGYYGDVSGRFRPLGIIPYDNNRFRIIVMDNTSSGIIVGSSALGLNTDGVSYKFSFILETN